MLNSRYLLSRLESFVYSILPIHIWALCVYNLCEGICILVTLPEQGIAKILLFLVRQPSVCGETKILSKLCMFVGRGGAGRHEGSVVFPGRKENGVHFNGRHQRSQRELVAVQRSWQPGVAVRGTGRHQIPKGTKTLEFINV